MNTPSTLGAEIDELEVLVDRLIADNATLRAALQTHAEEAAKLIAQRDELLGALETIVTAWEEGRQFSDKANEIGKARAAITKHTTNERK